MKLCFLWLSAVCVLLLGSLPKVALGAGGTTMVAEKGQPVLAEAGWPEGVDALLNDPARTTGWNSWFTEWPNDVNQYAFEIASTEELNRLLVKLAAIKSDLRQVRLSYLQEPNSLGWVTRLPAGNAVPVIFSLGNQATIDEWYRHTGNQFGKMTFTAAPVAVPPTLTIFVRNKAVKLDELVIPVGIEVVAGYVPTVFHRANTTLEREREQAGKEPAKPGEEKLDRESQAAAEAIEVFLKLRNFDRDR